jgi:radical SAM-linked protein
MESAKIRAVFSKTGDMKFISHLDNLRLFQRASRRAGLPVTITKGFSPHLKISITKALKLGAESAGEEAMFYMAERIAPERFKDRINANLPEGIRILDAEEIA